MDRTGIIEELRQGKCVLGIELGSTRIKAELIAPDNAPAAEGVFEWENRLEDGVWTYSLEDVHEGIRSCYADLVKNAEEKYGVVPARYAAMGVSAMMHGYMAFDADGKLLAPFRTWRNTITAEAAERLSELFRFNIPQRWSVAHLFQAVINGEEHVGRIAFLTTLAGYVHRLLTGEKVLGVGDASGMFPIDPATKDYNAEMLRKFDDLPEVSAQPWKLAGLLPACLPAGVCAGHLTEEGARLLDPSGRLEPGIPFCPPEGDAGTGMTATGAVRVRTGNVSAGTSIFGMIVLEKELSEPYPGIDIVTTPAGDPVGMAHCNTCTSDLDAWVGLFDEFCRAAGCPMERGKLYSVLYNAALSGDPDCGGVLAYNCFAGEPVIGLADGRPLLVRTPGAGFSLANFMRANLFAALAVLKSGMELLLKKEGVHVDNLMGHGGLFKTKGVGQRMLAAALNTPVTVMTTAGEGGAWGMALLASYMISGGGRSLADWLDTEVFASAESESVEPDPEDAAGLDRAMERYMEGLAIEQAAAEHLR